MAADEIVLEVDGWTSLTISQCRICHEEEEGDSKGLEAPCSCSGTLKFAHRECIQRWCDEKGNTTCEICLEKFEPGYTASPPQRTKKTRLADVAVTIRESLEVPRQNNELYSRRLLGVAAAEDELLETSYAEWPSASERIVSHCQSVALIFTTLLLVRHLISVLTGVPDYYAFTLLAFLVVKGAGILLPLYIMMQMYEMIRHWRWQQQQQQHDHVAEDELLP